jgi:hypothetical protein
MPQYLLAASRSRHTGIDTAWRPTRRVAIERALRVTVGGHWSATNSGTTFSASASGSTCRYPADVADELDEVHESIQQAAGVLTGLAVPARFQLTHVW